mmetsp:Transcript_14317/g.36192  ORF Transcript_14317/g.36192 Transcript_14317/m.36192 type:complete len:272 (-) Transcript_14317:609-1424(-)
MSIGPFTAAYNIHGRPSPTKMLMVLLPTALATAMSPYPCLATTKLPIASGTLVPAAITIRPMMIGGISAKHPRRRVLSTAKYVNPPISRHTEMNNVHSHSFVPGKTLSSTHITGSQYVWASSVSPASSIFSPCTSTFPASASPAGFRSLTAPPFSADTASRSAGTRISHKLRLDDTTPAIKSAPLLFSEHSDTLPLSVARIFPLSVRPTFPLSVRPTFPLPVAASLSLSVRASFPLSVAAILPLRPAPASMSPLALPMAAGASDSCSSDSS